MHATAQGFIEAICCEPHRDDLRLIYADYLDDEGEPERAEFIRLECRISELCEGHRQGKPQHPDFDALLTRESELWKANVKPICKWFLLLGIDPSDCVFNRGFPSHITLTEAAFLQHCEAIFRAAPITGVTLTDKEPQDYHNNDGPRLYGWHSGTFEVQKYGIDRELWFEVAEHGGVVHGVWVDFNTQAEAHAALSSACARQRAGLPPLGA